MARRTPDPGRPLSARERQFCAELAAGASRVDAVYRAFGRVSRPRGKPPTARTANAAQKKADRLLADSAVAAEYDAACLAARERAGVTAAEVLAYAGGLLRADPADLFRRNPDGGYSLPRRVEDIPPHARRVLRSVEVETRLEKRPDGGAPVEVSRVKFTVADPSKALALLWKHFGLDEKRAPLESVLAGLPPEVLAEIRAALPPPGDDA